MFKTDENYRYANLVVYQIDPKKYTRSQLLYQFANAMQVIRHLEQSGMPLEHCQYLERLFYGSLPQNVRNWLLRTSLKTYRYIRVSLAATYYSPDYTWKSGPNAGRTTLQIMKDEWNNHIQCLK